jgi:hypothetical protein
MEKLDLTPIGRSANTLKLVHYSEMIQMICRVYQEWFVGETYIAIIRCLDPNTNPRRPEYIDENMA